MKQLIIAPCILSLSFCVFADQTTVSVYTTGAVKKAIGEVYFKDSDNGVLITPNLKQLSPGLHGFHIHEKPDCNIQGMKAGGHYDPQNTNSHLGPYAAGHLGDLPVLYVEINNQAKTTTLAPYLHVYDLKNRSLMIHAGGDTYSNNPPMGGGGDRIACGVFPK